MVKRSLAEDGFYYVDDPVVGSRIQEMERNGFQFTSSRMEGWEFCDKIVLNDTLVRNSFESFYEFARLGYYRRIAADPGHVFQFRKGSQGPDIWLVQLWGKGSEAVYFPGSHRIEPRSFRTANRLWEVVQADLERAGITRTTKLFKEGGLVILDARLSLEMPNGDPITTAFVGANIQESIDTELRKWPKLRLPKLDTQAITELERRHISVHCHVEGEITGSDGGENVGPKTST
ncbi:hypothetical protein PG993_008639 [Apiospora rasikravindrae]|uniref:Uncharacterized protein n=1 Tax=Apiospora rasikravindrae TaxID=990691 RepID=A0ABR1SQQ7_9PEZI